MYVYGFVMVTLPTTVASLQPVSFLAMSLNSFWNFGIKKTAVIANWAKIATDWVAMYTINRQPFFANHTLDSVVAAVVCNMCVKPLRAHTHTHLCTYTHMHTHAHTCTHTLHIPESILNMLTLNISFPTPISLTPTTPQKTIK